MDSFTNTDVHARVWPSIQRPDGRTLALEPGESADLDVEPDDPYLRRDRKKSHTKSESHVTQQTGATAPTEAPSAPESDKE